MGLWGGRFEGKADPLFKQFNDSLPFDCRLVQQDITGSIAWAEALVKVGVLRAEEAARLTTALQEVAAVAAKDPAAVQTAGDEDVHSWVEARLIEKVGALGKKLHTGRSRNDQVATDFKLWTREQIGRRRAELRDVQAALVALAERELDTAMPGYTHLQRAQPVLFSHWCLAYEQMLRRDDGRFADAFWRAGECPLGSGALAGTAYPIDREALARSLGFENATANSLDAVSDRDFVFETLAAASLCALHLSRLAEDLIFYSTGEAGFVELPDALTSGSSLMPQKKNPDALELIRGKCGRVLGALVGLGVTIKGLPLAYNKDMQEDKEPLFDAMQTLSLCLRIIPPLLDGLTVRRAAARRAAAGGYSNATELADYLVAKGVPFREAHELVGRIVRRAIERGASLEELSIDEMKSIAPQVSDDVRVHLTVDSAIAKRDVPGGTAPNRVADAVQRAKARLGERHPEEGSAETHTKAAAGEVEVRAATLDDVPEICALINYWMEKGENLPRSEEEVIRSIADFGVAVADEKVIGCASLLLYTSDLAEIRSLGVDPGFHGGGAGSRLVDHFVDRAAELRIPRVFVLTRAPAFFDRLGFHTVSIDTLPEKVWKDCRMCPKQNCCDEIAMVREVPLD